MERKTKSASYHCGVINKFALCPCSLSPSPSYVKSEEGSDLDELLERAVDWGAGLGSLVEIDGGEGALADAFGSEFEFLGHWLAAVLFSLRLFFFFFSFFPLF